MRKEQQQAKYDQISLQLYDEQLKLKGIYDSKETIQADIRATIGKCVDEARKYSKLMPKINSGDVDFDYSTISQVSFSDIGSESGDKEEFFRTR